MYVEQVHKATVTFESEGHKITMNLTIMGSDINIQTTAQNPDNLKEQKGVHCKLVDIFLNALRDE